MSPLLDPALQDRAAALDCLLVPGVMTPSEIRQATKLGCRLSSCFRPVCWVAGFVVRLRRRWVRSFLIAAGGLRAVDLSSRLRAGYDAIALGRTVFEDDRLDLPGRLAQAMSGSARLICYT